MKPKTPKKKRGDLYWDLFEEVMTQYPGEWMEVREFTGRESASRAKRLILDGTNKVPGELAKWEITAEITTRTGESRLYARWMG